MIGIYIFGGLVIVSIVTVVHDYYHRKKLGNQIKVGDNRRLFTENEVTFDSVEVVKIYKNKKGKRIAKCKYEDGKIYEYPCSDLIY
jgi:hypothetical protein